MIARKLALALALALVGSGTAFADAHTIKYSRKTAALGDTITLAGQDFKLVRMPFRLFSGEKYYVILPAMVDAASNGSLQISTSHDTGQFVPNGTIDGIPAQISLDDVRNYGLNGQIGTDAAFTVYAYALLNLTLKIQSTLVMIQSYVYKPADGYETLAEVGGAFNIQPFAQWAVYTDPVQQVQAMNDYVDYIRVIAVP